MDSLDKQPKLKKMDMRFGEGNVRSLYGAGSLRTVLGRTKRRCVNSVKMNLDRMGWYGLDRAGSGYGPVEDSCEHGNELSGSIKF
jgi:hypothetical protein